MFLQEKTSKTHKKNPAVLIVAAIGIVLAAIIMVFIICYNNKFSAVNPANPQKDDGKMAEDILRLSEETYSAVFLSMHSTIYFKEEDFVQFRGVDTLVASHSILNTKELSQYIECILNSDNAVSNLFICPDPELIWITAKQKVDMWERSLKLDFYSYIEAHPNITFSILLPYPYISYWLELDTDKLDTLLTLYHTLINELSPYPNVQIFFPGAESWLTLNPDNYEGTLFDANEVITNSILLHTFCDADYMITPENEERFWATLRETIDREKVSPTLHADLSDWCFVFFGDSILGNYPGSFSIPGYVDGLSDAVIFNFAIGGTSASFFPGNGRTDFPSFIDSFLAENTTLSTEGFCFTPDGISENELADKKLCFLINYGFNDYFDGAPVENPQDPYDICSFKGSLRTCITKLQDVFPDAHYILMTPTHTGAFNSGTDSINKNGDIFLDYINAIIEIAEETDSLLLDNYNTSIITEDNLDDYLADGVHPNETGRLAIADRIIRFVETEMP